MGINEKAPLTLLLVEDDRGTRDLLSLILERTGHRIITAEDGLEGLAAFKDYAPDLIITDIKMPHMSGLEMIHCVRGCGGQAGRTPIIVMTASDEEILAEALAAGADLVGRKPADMRRLPAFIEEVLAAKYAARYVAS